MTTRADLIRRLRAAGEGDGDALDLAETALALATLDRPGVDPDPYRRHLTLLAEASSKVTGATASVAAQLIGLREVIVHRHGYRGDDATYDDTRNANLMHVIDRRKGLPVALGILYVHVIDAYGGRVAGLNFPSHFLIRMEARGQRVIVDPFDALRPLAAHELRGRLKKLLGQDAEIEPDHYRSVSRRDILIRLQNNIKMRALAKGDLRRSLRILETLTALAPARSDFWWELALVHYQIGNVGTAVRLLEDYLASPRALDNTRRLEDLLRKLKSRMS